MFLRTAAALLAIAAVACTPARPSGPAGAPRSGAPTAAAAATGSATAAPGASASTGAAAPPAPPFTSTHPVDVLIRGGSVVDGSGAAPVRADVVVEGGRIVHVGAVDAAVTAAETIDATGRFVAPGFIDAHSHADPAGRNDNLVAQGVTTACVGQDGKSPTELGIAVWARNVEQKGPVVNLAPFVGHASVRVAAGVGVRTPSAGQLARMVALVSEAMDDGAFGLSTGLEYAPGRFAKVDELVALARPVADHDGVVMSHLRSEDDRAIDAALDELLEQGRRAKARVHVSHIKVVEGHGAERADRLLERLAKARAEGVSVTADIYPYAASYTGVDILFPDWAKPAISLGDAKKRRLDELRAWLRRRVTERNGPEATVFGTPPWAGKTLAAVARDLGKPFEDALIDDVAPAGASAAYFVMDEALQARLLLDPHVMIGTDGATGSAHPRAYGTFARVLATAVARDKSLTVEEAVRKMTSLPARTLGLEGERGRLAPGLAADLVVFELARVRDVATFENPQRLAEGFDAVLVNGVAVKRGGRFTQARPGKVLRHGKR